MAPGRLTRGIPGSRRTGTHRVASARAGSSGSRSAFDEGREPADFQLQTTTTRRSALRRFRRKLGLASTKCGSLIATGDGDHAPRSPAHFGGQRREILGGGDDIELSPARSGWENETHHQQRGVQTTCGASGWPIGRMFHRVPPLVRLRKKGPESPGQTFRRGAHHGPPSRR